MTVFSRSGKILPREDPEAADIVFSRLERSYYEMGKFGDLLQVYEGLIQDSPNSSAAQIALADMHRRRGRPEEAVHLLRSILSGAPGNHHARRLLIRCLVQTGETESAIEAAETRWEQLDSLSADPEVARDGDRMREITHERRGLEDELTELNQRWDDLADELTALEAGATSGLS